jgi:hypothetical protein
MNNDVEIGRVFDVADPPLEVAVWGAEILEQCRNLRGPGIGALVDTEDKVTLFL